MRKRPSILAHLIIFGLIATLPLIALLSYNIYTQYDEGRKDALALIEPLRISFAQQISTFLGDIEGKLAQLSHLSGVVALDPIQTQEKLSETLVVHPNLQCLVLLDQAGRLIATTEAPSADPGGMAPDLSWAGKGLAAEGFFLTDAFRDPTTGMWTCAVSHPVSDASGKRIGTLFARLNLIAFSQRFFSALTNSQTVVVVYDRQGTQVMRSTHAAQTIGTPSDFMFPALIKNGADQWSADYTDQSGVQFTYTIGKIPGSPWFNGVRIPHRVIFSAALASYQRSLWLLGGFVLLLAGTIGWFARSLSLPITTLAQSARTITQGQADNSTLLEGPAEIMETAQAFKEMAAVRDQIQAAFDTSKLNYRTIIDLVPHFIFAKDADGRFVLANRAVAEVYQTTPAELIGKRSSDFPGNPEEEERFLAENKTILATGQTLRVAKERFTDPTGRIRFLSTTKTPINFIPGGERVILGVAVDITALVQAAEEHQRIEKKLLETQKLESLGVLAGGIAHDFNNLLTGIIGNAGLARLDLPPGTSTCAYLAEIEKTSLRAADLCKQMLAYSGKGRFVIQRLNLNDLLNDTTQLLSISINKKSVLRFNLEPSLPPILADATQLRQVLMNLVINASEAIGDRPGTILLSTGCLTVDDRYLHHAQLAHELTPGEYIYFEVSDNGTGMAPETIARIFDPFFTTKFTGRGLGLAAVQGIVHGHKGAIRVYSELGQGTTIKLYFPSTKGAADALQVAAPAVNNWRGSGRALVVDDDESVRQVSSMIMTRLGYTVDTAVDGLEAIKLFKPQVGAYEVILLDLTMPHLDGEETFRQLRLLQPDVRIILMSGFNKVEAINRFLGKGLAGFVQKPFELETLTAELRRVAERAVGSKTTHTGA